MMNLAGARSNSTIPTAQPIIIDTDIFSDVDDLGAIATANVLHNCGLADLRGVAINTQSRYGALATSVRFSLVLSVSWNWLMLLPLGD